MPSSEPFRLLGLPREVRDLIYDEMLCDWPESGEPPPNPASDGNIQVAVMAPRIEPNILLANEQIHQEAKQAMLKGNHFIHIAMIVRDASIIKAIFLLPRHNIPVVASGRDRATLFKEIVVMTHNIDYPDITTGSPSAIRFDAILLRRDLKLFCNILAGADVFARYDCGHSHHKITIHNPFAKTLTPDFLNPKNQERLLEAYPRALQGFDHFRIEGEVEPDLAKTTVARVFEEAAFPARDAFLEELHRWRELGSQAVRDNDIDKAAEYRTLAMFMIKQAVNRRGWPHLEEAGGKEFTDCVSELAFKTYRDRARGQIRLMQADMAGGQEHVRRFADSLYLACWEAANIGGKFRTNWNPSRKQLGSIYYLIAQGHQIMKYDVDRARRFIRVAKELRPNDPLVEAEMGQIERWKAELQSGHTG